VKFASVCDGIGAAATAWGPLGWRFAFKSEIEPFPNAVSDFHHPTVPNYGDMTQYRNWPHEQLDVLVGGTPCQSFSVAGLRKGLADPRGSLTLVFLGVVERYAPRWVVWENVPGVLSDASGAFGAFLGGLGQLGYGFAYRVLDAQYFGLAQRRRRVFVVGHSGGQWQRAAAVLFERASLCGHPAPSRETRERIAPTISARTQGGGGLGTDFDLDGGVIPIHDTATRHAGTDGSVRQNGKGHGFGVGGPNDPMFPLTKGDKQGLEDQHVNSGCGLFVPDKPIFATSGQSNAAFAHDAALALNRTNEPPYLAHQMAVRRLTPRECERLQGFPDDFTLIPYRGKPAEQCPDGPRYKALGNSMAVPVMHWIGERIQSVEELENL
jgi:DNA (cytosine-5)-methyltransferase 1